MSGRTRCVVAGTFAADYSRNRIVLDLLTRGGFDVEVVRYDLWGDRRHTIVNARKWPILLRAIAVYPRLVLRLLTTKRPDVLVVLYPGHFDMPFVALVARLRRIPILYDHFISLEETIVGDRALTSENSISARVLRLVDRWACRAAHLVLADTPADARYFASQTGVPGERFRILWVGAQEDVFAPADRDPEPRLVFFHGTYIPLHGIDTIVRAAKLLEHDRLRIRLLGDGQERPAIERLIRDLGVTNVELAPPIPLRALPDEIAAAQLCLGIFGTTPKAARVVPNKVYEYVAMGKPVVTADTEGIRSAFDGEVGVVPPGDPQALAAKIRSLLADQDALATLASSGRERFARDYSAPALTRLLADYVDELAG